MVVLGLDPLWPQVKFVFGLPKFKYLATPGCLLPVGVFNPVMFYLDYLLLIVFEWSVYKLAG